MFRNLIFYLYSITPYINVHPPMYVSLFHAYCYLAIHLHTFAHHSSNTSLYPKSYYRSTPRCTGFHLSTDTILYLFNSKNTLTMFFSHVVISLVTRSVHPNFDSITMLQVVFPLPFIFGSVFNVVSPVPVSLVHYPLTFKDFTVGMGELAKPMSLNKKKSNAPGY